MDDPSALPIHVVVREARAARGLSASELAQRSGVSRAMIAKVERGDAQPTAQLLGRLSAALGMTLSELVARAEGEVRQLRHRDEQPVWTDPDSGYSRRALSPRAGGPLELIEVALPAGARVSYPAEAYAFVEQQLWMLDGALSLRDDDAEHHLVAGDCLQLGPPAARTFANVTDRPCRYLVALALRPPA